jgi:uncharacterized protein
MASKISASLRREKGGRRPPDWCRSPPGSLNPARGDGIPFATVGDDLAVDVGGRQCHQGLVRPCFSEEILEEYVGVLARPEICVSGGRDRGPARDVPPPGELIVPDASTAVSVDPSDTKFLQCTETAQADYLVTGNKRHFPEASYGVTRVLSAGELLDWIALEL